LLHAYTSSSSGASTEDGTCYDTATGTQKAGAKTESGNNCNTTVENVQENVKDTQNITSQTSTKESEHSHKESEHSHKAPKAPEAPGVPEAPETSVPLSTESSHYSPDETVPTVPTVPENAEPIPTEEDENPPMDIVDIRTQTPTKEPEHSQNALEVLYIPESYKSIISVEDFFSNGIPIFGLDHSFEQSPCYPIIGSRSNEIHGSVFDHHGNVIDDDKTYTNTVYYCKLHPDLGSTFLTEIELHCREKEPDIHKAAILAKRLHKTDTTAGESA
jgi:hypothetical protein